MPRLRRQNSGISRISRNVTAEFEGRSITISIFELEQLIAIVDHDNNDSLDKRELVELLEYIAIDNPQVRDGVCVCARRKGLAALYSTAYALCVWVCRQIQASSVFERLDADGSGHISVRAVWSASAVAANTAARAMLF